MKHLWLLSSILVFLGFTALVITKPLSQDEGVFLTIGKYMAQGQVPYHDFFDHKPPGIHFLLAGLFSIFGPNLWAAKTALIISVLFSAVLVIKIGEKLKTGTGLLATTIFLFLMTQFEGYYLIAEPFLLLPLLLAVWLLFKKSKNAWWLFMAGVSLALVPMLKQTAVLSVVPVLFLLRGVSRQGVIFFFTGLIAPWILLSTYLMAQGIAGEAWQQVVVLTLTNYPRESLGFVLNMLHHNFLWTLPIWVLALLGISMRVEKRTVLLSLILLPFPLMFFRHYAHYWVQILPFVAMIAATVLVRLDRRRVMMAIVFFCLAIAGGKIGQDAVPNWPILQEQLRVAKVLAQEPVDVILAENQFTGFYFLLPQRPLNKYLYLTEVTEPEQAEQQTITDLDTTQKVMILWPSDPRFAYAKKLQQIIPEHFQLSQTFPKLGLDVWESR